MGLAKESLGFQTIFPHRSFSSIWLEDLRHRLCLFLTRSFQTFLWVWITTGVNTRRITGAMAKFTQPPMHKTKEQDLPPRLLKNTHSFSDKFYWNCHFLYGLNASYSPYLLHFHQSLCMIALCYMLLTSSHISVLLLVSLIFWPSPGNSGLEGWNLDEVPIILSARSTSCYNPNSFK